MSARYIDRIVTSPFTSQVYPGPRHIGPCRFAGAVLATLCEQSKYEPEVLADSLVPMKNIKRSPACWEKSQSSRPFQAHSLGRDAGIDERMRGLGERKPQWDGAFSWISAVVGSQEPLQSPGHFHWISPVWHRSSCVLWHTVAPSLATPTSLQLPPPNPPTPRLCVWSLGGRCSGERCP